MEIIDDMQEILAVFARAHRHTSQIHRSDINQYGKLFIPILMQIKIYRRVQIELKISFCVGKWEVCNIRMSSNLLEYMSNRQPKIFIQFKTALECVCFFMVQHDSTLLLCEIVFTFFYALMYANNFPYFITLFVVRSEDTEYVRM